MLACDERGDFAFLELKILTKSSKLKLSPHQCAWITRHKHARVFIVGVLHGQGLRVFHASQAVELASRNGEVVPIAEFEAGDWTGFFSFLFPTEEV